MAILCCVAGLLNDNNRLGEFMKVSTTFEELVAASRGEVMATITTAEVGSPTPLWSPLFYTCPPPPLGRVLALTLPFCHRSLSVPIFAGVLMGLHVQNYVGLRREGGGGVMQQPWAFWLEVC